MKLTPITLGLLFTSILTFSQTKNQLKTPTTQNQEESVIMQNNTDLDTTFTKTDLKFLEHCLTLAEEALKAGDQPFGSILVNADNEIIAEARNRINEKNVLAHPEIELAEWAMENLSFEQRRQTIMYTTGEHCPMCAGAHSWAQIGALYYLSSAEQLGKWLNEFGVDPALIVFIPANKIMKNITIKGPAKGDLLKEIKQKHKRYYKN